MNKSILIRDLANASSYYCVKIKENMEGVGAGHLIDELFTVYLSDRNICSTQRFFWSCPGWT